MKQKVTRSIHRCFNLLHRAGIETNSSIIGYVYHLRRRPIEKQPLKMHMNRRINQNSLLGPCGGPPFKSARGGVGGSIFTNVGGLGGGALIETRICRQLKRLDLPQGILIAFYSGRRRKMECVSSSCQFCVNEIGFSPNLRYWLLPIKSLAHVQSISWVCIIG